MSRPLYITKQVKLVMDKEIENEDVWDENKRTKHCDVFKEAKNYYLVVRSDLKACHTYRI